MGRKKEHSNLIKEHLKKRGITQTWLAKELGMSFSITNAYVCNRKQPNLVTIFKVADLLGVSPKDLIE
ncbi:helix-turn-helix domain-containing protein [Prevotella pallens]|uniref:helix-turn-helix domain-containing protein n=1 Tax=Prevotella pallens TaxID=60133 RepID=UPI001CB3D765|nr:helix-turn-helix transcriptional regulator [Prevotella pallens]MBF1463384.1 helix-turn-helix transcriptional regulator [Prevotella pallens]